MVLAWPQGLGFDCNRGFKNWDRNRNGQELGAGNIKSRDLGYALAISSCEEANNVETCTVTALDAIAAFAVPNPNCSSRFSRFFRLWLPVELPRQADHSAYFELAKFNYANRFSRRRQADEIAGVAATHP